jgi:antitoxin MazE
MLKSLCRKSFFRETAALTSFQAMDILWISGGDNMITQIKDWGNSQGIRIPKELLREAGMQKDDDLDISLVDGALLLRKVHRHKSLEERARECDGKIGPYMQIICVVFSASLKRSIPSSDVPTIPKPVHIAYAVPSGSFLSACDKKIALRT